jgi:hypothetical protein
MPWARAGSLAGLERAARARRRTRTESLFGALAKTFATDDSSGRFALLLTGGRAALLLMSNRAKAGEKLA